MRDKHLSESDFIAVGDSIAGLHYQRFTEDGIAQYAVQFELIHDGVAHEYLAIGDACGFHDFIERDDR